MKEVECALLGWFFTFSKNFNSGIFKYAHPFRVVLCFYLGQQIKFNVI